VLINIFPRKMNFKFPKSITRHWLGNSVFKTHLLNSFTLLFPAGEKFFVRSINKFMKDIEDPKLRAEVKAFIQQETQHYLEHEKFFENLKNEGFEIDKLTGFLDAFIERVPDSFNSDKVNLSLTAGLEHITALLAEISLKDGFLKDACTEMRELFEWHAAEELEHRSVAYDVLQTVDNSYSLRVVGLIYAYLLMGGFSGLFTISLISQDQKLFDRKVWKEFSDVFFMDNALFLKAFFVFIKYLHPDFHPSDNAELDELFKGILSNDKASGPMAVPA
jgi:predicted metal-dependent hydrolase